MWPSFGRRGRYSDTTSPACDAPCDANQLCRERRRLAVERVRRADNSCASPSTDASGAGAGSPDADRPRRHRGQRRPDGSNGPDQHPVVARRRQAKRVPSIVPDPSGAPVVPQRTVPSETAGPRAETPSWVRSFQVRRLRGRRFARIKAQRGEALLIDNQTCVTARACSSGCMSSTRTTASARRSSCVAAAWRSSNS